MTWIVYIIQCADGSLYTGITNHLAKRLQAHQAGTGARYTRGRRPFVLVYQEICETRSAASRREIVIKRLRRPQKLALIQTVSQKKPM